MSTTVRDCLIFYYLGGGCLSSSFVLLFTVSQAFESFRETAQNGGTQSHWYLAAPGLLVLLGHLAGAYVRRSMRQTLSFSSLSP